MFNALFLFFPNTSLPHSVLTNNGFRAAFTIPQFVIGIANNLKSMGVLMGLEMMCSSREPSTGNKEGLIWNVFRRVLSQETEEENID